MIDIWVVIKHKKDTIQFSLTPFHFEDGLQAKVHSIFTH